MKTAMRAASHAIALGGLLVGGAVWTISQQHPLYANPGRLLRLPAAVVDASQPTEDAFRIGQVLTQYTHDRALAFRIADAIVDQAKKENLDPALLVKVFDVARIVGRGVAQAFPCRKVEIGRAHV